MPGAIRGWDALHRQGAVLPWRRAFDAAADAADGFPVSRDLAWSLARGGGTLHEDAGIADVFFGHGLLTEGDTLAQPALARTLRVLADEGPDAFYAGELGSRFVEGLRAFGATLSTEDLASHAADLLPPLRGRYRDLDVSVTPPCSQGFVLLEALAAVERLGIDPDPTGPDAATLARVLMAASADRDRHLADPASMRVHVSSLLDEGHIAALCDIARGRLEDHAARVLGRSRPGHDRARRRRRRRVGRLADREPVQRAGARGSSSRSPGSSPTIAGPVSRSSPDIRTSSRRGSGPRTR